MYVCIHILNMYLNASSIQFKNIIINGYLYCKSIYKLYRMCGIDEI